MDAEVTMTAAGTPDPHPTRATRAGAADDSGDTDEKRVFAIEVALLLDAVLARYQQDFRDYSTHSLHRRVREAMRVLQCATVSELQGRVLRDADAFARLLNCLTVHVSEMFRDPGYFLAVRNEVVPVLRTFPSVKVWVAGCSTGEEAWSLAILLHEEGLLERTLIYATDIDPQALRRARSGIYPLERMPKYTRNYLEAGGTRSLAEYFVAHYGGAAFKRDLAAQMVFTEHSLATDNVFSEVHFASCRNVLIYFDAPLQDRAVGLFREALVHRGFLGLGSRESIRFGAHADAFDELADTGTLYRKRAPAW
jgi:chemotaxis protein methyltransferase CheR